MYCRRLEMQDVFTSVHLFSISLIHPEINILPLMHEKKNISKVQPYPRKELGFSVRNIFLINAKRQAKSACT